MRAKASHFLQFFQCSDVAHRACLQMIYRRVTTLFAIFSRPALGYSASASFLSASELSSSPITCVQEGALYQIHLHASHHHDTVLSPSQVSSLSWFPQYLPGVKTPVHTRKHVICRLSLPVPSLRNPSRLAPLTQTHTSGGTSTYAMLAPFNLIRTRSMSG